VSSCKEKVVIFDIERVTFRADLAEKPRRAGRYLAEAFSCTVPDGEGGQR